MPAIPTRISIQAQARFAGVLYFFIIIVGIFAEGFVRGRLIDYGDATATAQNILANETLFRIGFVAEVALLLADTAIAALFWVMFRPVNETLSISAASFRLMSIAVSAAKALLFIAPVMLLTGAGFEGVGSENLAGLSLAALKLHGQGYNLSLIFFGVHCLLVGALIYRSGFLPRAIGMLMGLAGLCYLISSFAGFLAPPLAGLLFPWILLPCLGAEGALCLWLIVRGVDRARWEAPAV